MSRSESWTVTRLLGERRDGRSRAMDELFPPVYDDLRRRAHAERITRSLDEMSLEASLSQERVEASLALEESLVRLEQENPRHGRIVECRFSGGMTIRDSAATFGTFPATVKRGWTIARACLYRDIRSRLQGSGA